MARRSVLFTPGDRPEMLRGAPSSGADVLVFDLEDGVAPARKADARARVRSVLADPEFDPDAEVCLRVNATHEVIEADLDAVVESPADCRIDSVMRPKVSRPAAISTLETMLTDRGIDVPILALIESARGVLAASEIAAEPATDALVFGAEDLAADVGMERTPEATETLYARQRVVLAARAHGCDAIDTLVTDFEDEAQLRGDTERSVQFGYDGKLAIHPRQVGPINEAYRPDRAAIEWAESVLEAKRDADADGRGVFVVDGEMIDAPRIAQAERIRERAQAADRNS